MPISPAYEWSETPTTLTITAQCRGATSASTNVFSSPHYVSFNASPYFLELDLQSAIDSTQSVATVRQGVVTLKLTKAQEGLWGRLLVDLPRAERLKRRDTSRKLAEAEAEAALERKKRMTWEESRYSLGKQMDKDRAARHRIDSLKEDELKAERTRLESWTQELDGKRVGSRAHPAKPSSFPSGRTASETAALRREGLLSEDSASRIVDITDEAPPLVDADKFKDVFKHDISEEEDDDDTAAATGAPPPPPPPPAPAKKPAPPAVALPPVRGTGKIKIGFTKQLLTAPARTKGAVGDTDYPLDPLTAPDLFKSRPNDGDISQRDPAWLKDRGDRFFRMGDSRSAEEAYTMALNHFKERIMGQAIDCVVACWSNRAACRIQRKAFLDAAEDCGHALVTMAKARCVTEYPKSETALVRSRLRLHTRRGVAFANAGVLHRALVEFKVALTYAEGNLPSDAADRQMLHSDIQALVERHEAMVKKLTEADELLASHQQSAVHEGGGEAPKAHGPLTKAKELYDAALELVPLEVAALANRAACHLYLGEPFACDSDCTKALTELDAEAKRATELAMEHTGLFAEPIPPEDVMAMTNGQAAKADKLRFELLRRRAAARIEESEAHFPQAAMDLKECLKLRPADPATIQSLDELSRRAAAAGVELEPLPPAMPSQLALTSDNGSAADDADDDDDAAPDEVEANDGDAEGQKDAEGAKEGGADGASSAASRKPPTGTRSAAALKGDADTAFKEARLGKAVALYGKALKADAQAEWFGEGKGLLFRCQCLANRSACHLKMHAFADTVEDAGAAIAALSTGLVQGQNAAEAEALLLKLLARRGMALCQLTRYDEAAADYTRAAELDPQNEQLKKDLQLIEAARGSGQVV